MSNTANNNLNMVNSQNNPHYKEYKTLQILQYNVGKRRTVMLDLFINDEVNNIDIIAIQEPWRNSETGLIPNMDKDHFELVYLMNNSRARVCFFINKKAALAGWQYKTYSNDLSTVTVKTSDGRKIRVHNIYNQPITEGSLGLLNTASTIYWREHTTHGAKARLLSYCCSMLPERLTRSHTKDFYMIYEERDTGSNCELD